VLWGLGFSLLLHILLLLLGVTLLPVLARRWASAEPPFPPQVLTFKFKDNTTDVDQSSRVQKPPPTPLQGQFASQARDREPGASDTPIPAGGMTGPENTLAKGAPNKNAAVPSAPPPTDADVTTPSSRAATRAVLQDALRSETAMLTGRQEPPGRVSGTTPQPRTQENTANGALQFGDFAFSTTAWEFQPYWTYMRSRLYANWYPPAAYRDYGIINGGWTMVRAVLDRQGRLLNCKIVGQSGHASLHPASYSAMLGAAPFRPLPADFPDDSLVVTVRFMYLPPGVAADRDRP